MPSIQTTIARELNLTAAQVAAVIDLVDQGNTIPFIARYRKEATGGIDALVDPKAKDADTVSLLAYLSPDQKFDKLLENQHVLAEPVVRNGKQATVGYAPDVWKTWE